MSTEINATINDIQFRRISSDNLTRFRGKLGSFAFITDDHMRLVAFDGSTLGGASKVALLNSADFTITPTAPNVEDLSSVDDSAILNIHDVKEVLSDLGEDVLANKLDHTIVKDSSDIDSEVKDGFYFITNGTNTPYNSSGYLLVHSGNDSVAQIWITYKENEDIITPEIYIRFFGNKQTAWYKYLTSADLNVDDLAKLSSDNIFYKNIEIKGELTGPTIDSKLNHTIKSSVTDLDLVLEDGLYYFNSISPILHTPSGVKEFFLHVHSCENIVLQEMILIKGKILFRNNKSGSFTEWIDQQIDIPDATASVAGIVKISDLPVSGDNTTAFSVGGAYVFSSKLDTVEKQAETNQEKITEISAKLDTVITDVKIADVTNPESFTKLEVVSGTVTLPLSSYTSFGVTRPATKDEAATFTSTTTFISPAILKETAPILIEDAFVNSSGSSGGDTFITNVTNSIVESPSFSESVTELIKKEGLQAKVISSTEFNPENMEKNILYLITE